MNCINCNLCERTLRQTFGLPPPLNKGGKVLAPLSKGAVGVADWGFF